MRWTYADLDRRARAVAAAIRAQAQVGDRAVLVFPPGLDFLAAFFGCLYAGVLPAPATYPKPRRPSSRLDAITQDCAPKIELTTAATLAGMRLDEQSAAVRALEWLAVDQCDLASAIEAPLRRQPSDPAFLQYTSGSTSEPRGVVVTHGNLLHKLELIRGGFGLRPVVTGDSESRMVRNPGSLPSGTDFLVVAAGWGGGVVEAMSLMSVRPWSRMQAFAGGRAPPL